MKKHMILVWVGCLGAAVFGDAFTAPELSSVRLAGRAFAIFERTNPCATNVQACKKQTGRQNEKRL